MQGLPSKELGPGTTPGSLTEGTRHLLCARLRREGLQYPIFQQHSWTVKQKILFARCVSGDRYAMTVERSHTRPLMSPGRSIRKELELGGFAAHIVYDLVNRMCCCCLHIKLQFELNFDENTSNQLARDRSKSEGQFFLQPWA